MSSSHVQAMTLAVRSRKQGVICRRSATTLNKSSLASMQAFIPEACQLLREVDVITTDSKYWGRETEYRTANAHLPEAEKVRPSFSHESVSIRMNSPGPQHYTLSRTMMASAECRCPLPASTS